MTRISRILLFESGFAGLKDYQDKKTFVQLETFGITLRYLLSVFRYASDKS